MVRFRYGLVVGWLAVPFFGWNGSSGERFPFASRCPKPFDSKHLAIREKREANKQKTSEPKLRIENVAIRDLRFETLRVQGFLKLRGVSLCDFYFAHLSNHLIQMGTPKYPFKKSTRGNFQGCSCLATQSGGLRIPIFDC